MKLIKGKLYKIVKTQRNTIWFTNCVGCVLRYLGNNTKDHMPWAKPIKPKKGCETTRRCLVIGWSLMAPNSIRLKKYTPMVEFCKKLKRKLDNDRQRNKRST